MSFFVTFDDSENPLLTAAKKISSEFVTEPNRFVSMLAQQQMQIAAFQYGDFCHKVHWSPNWEECGQRDFPSGFQFTVHDSAPIIGALFEHVPMFSTTLAFPLDAGESCSRAMKTGKVVDDHFFRNPSYGIAADVVKNVDDSQLGACDTNFSGVFSTSERTAEGYQKKLWCVTQSHSNKVSASVQQMIAGAAPDDLEASLAYGKKLANNNFKADASVVGLGSPPHVTWKELFIENSDMRALQQKQKTHCAKTMLKFMQACKLGTVAKTANGPANLDALLASASLVETQRNCVDHISKDESLLAYLSDMTSMHSAAPLGAVVVEAPRLGPTILKGPWKVKSASGEVIGFPSSVGRKMSVNAHNKDTSLVHEDLVQTGTHVWNSEAPLNTSLSKTLHRRRTSRSWNDAELRLGFDAREDEQIHLEPVLVVLASTKQPQ